LANEIAATLPGVSQTAGFLGAFPSVPLLFIAEILKETSGFLWSSIKCTTTLREVSLDHSPSRFTKNT
jgi:hypothetical protein